MLKDIKFLIISILLVPIFLILLLSIPVIFLEYVEYQQYEFEKKLEEKMYITELYKIVGKFHIGKRSFGGFGGDIISYIAVCDSSSKNCYQVNGIRLDEVNINLYSSGGFLQNEENIFAIFTQETMNFYSINDLKELPEEQQKILLELKEKPRFIYE